MFQRTKKVDLNQTDTLIGKETAVEGRLRSRASVRIEGQIKGDIECDGDCVIGESGSVESNIRARNVSIAGKVKGDVFVQEKLTLLSTGVLYGDSHASTFIIEEGGSFNGKSSMNEKSESKPIDRVSTDESKTESLKEAESVS